MQATFSFHHLLAVEVGRSLKFFAHVFLVGKLEITPWKRLGKKWSKEKEKYSALGLR